MTAKLSTRRNEVRLLVMILGFAGLLAATSLVLNGVTWVRLQSSVRLTQEYTQRLAEWRQLQNILLEMEISTRGYMLTGEERQKEAADAARRTFMEGSAKLITANNHKKWTAEERAHLEAVTDKAVVAATEISVLRRQNGREAAEAYFMQVDTPALLDEIRTAFSTIIRHQEEAIQERTDAMRFDMQAGVVTSIATGILALGMGGIALLLLQRVVREMNRVERYASSILRAEKAKQQKDTFVAMMSHEIRTPLNAIIGFSQLLEQEANTPTTRRYTQSILTGGQALLQLINDILDLSKIEAGMMNLNEEPTHLCELATFCERMFQEQCSAKGVKLKVHCEEDLPESLILDAVRIRQILINLLGNAVKFTEKGSIALTIESKPVSGAANAHDLTIRVTDTGPGISEEDHSRVFEPFVQTQEGQTEDAGRSTRGTGLGLSIVSRFIKMMGGEVQLQSQQGKGSTFTIFLPGVLASARRGKSHNFTEEEVDFNLLQPSTILAADDNPTNRELIEAIFRNTHHTVHSAENGEEALRIMEQVRPDIVLMDIRMPVMDGIEATHMIKKNREFQRIPVLAVTAGSLGNEVRTSEETKYFDAWLRKPFTRRSLFEEMSEFLKPIEEPGDEEPEPAFEPVSGEVAHLLEAMHTGQWPVIQSRMIVSEVAEFATSLQTIGNQHSVEPLQKYSARLKSATETFAIQRMSTMLKDFPNLLRKLGAEPGKG